MLFQRAVYEESIGLSRVGLDYGCTRKSAVNPVKSRYQLLTELQSVKSSVFPKLAIVVIS